MPRVHHVRKARKSYPHDNITAGQEYWWWQFAFGAKIRSNKPPVRSQLTQSGFLSNLYDMQDGMANRFIDIDSIADDKQVLYDELEQMKQECEDSLENMPEGLRETSSSGELLQERIDALDEWLDELDGVDTDYDEDLDKTEKVERFEEIVQAILETDSHL